MGWVIQRYWRRLGTRQAFATSPTNPDAVYLHLHSEVAITRHIKVQGNRSPYDGDWVYWSTRQGRHPDANPRLAKLLKEHQGVVATAGCSSNMTTGSRWIISMGITKIRAPLICKRFMDTAMIRKRGNKGTTYRQVCVTSTRILRSGVPGNGHAPFWNSGRRGDPSTDCIGMWSRLLSLDGGQARPSWTIPPHDVVECGPFCCPWRPILGAASPFGSCGVPWHGSPRERCWSFSASVLSFLPAIR